MPINYSVVSLDIFLLARPRHVQSASHMFGEDRALSRGGSEGRYVSLGMDWARHSAIDREVHTLNILGLLA